MSTLECLPTFLRRLTAPEVKTVLLGGCGGGFDFVHASALVPLLRSAGKQVVIHSFSFGDPRRIGGESEVVFAEGDAVARRVTASSHPDPAYGPEVHLCSFLDQQFPGTAPHAVYASYARSFTAPALSRLLRWMVTEHRVDAALLVDGGSDSLMRGDEEGLGDPIEDAVSVAALAELELETKILACVGLGTDRFNHVSDGATLRAIAELTTLGGFLGAWALEPGGAALTFYEGLLQHVYGRQSFRSVLAGAIATAARGGFGSAPIDARFVGRTEPGDVWLWPLMALFFSFDAAVVARRSLIVQWIRRCTSVEECYAALDRGRAGVQRRPVEDLPRHLDRRNPHGRFY